MKNPPKDDRADEKTSPRPRPKAASDPPQGNSGGQPGAETSGVPPPGKRDRAARLDRDLKAVQLRRNGRTYDQIARACGYANRSAAYKAVARALELAIREPAEEVITLELMRLDRMLLGLRSAAYKGGVGAVDAVLKIMDRRARLLGLDKAAKFDGQWTVRDVVAEMEDRAANHTPDQPPIGHPAREQGQWQAERKEPG